MWMVVTKGAAELGSDIFIVIAGLFILAQPAQIGRKTIYGCQRCRMIFSIHAAHSDKIRFVESEGTSEVQRMLIARRLGL